MAVLISRCSSDKSVNPAPVDYDGSITQAWEQFANQNYEAAIEEFNNAKSLDNERYEAFCGLGWSYFKNDQFPHAITEFSNGEMITDHSVDIEAGWAFTLNADNEFQESNLQVDIVLAADSNWTFSYGLQLNSVDLIILKAENYFLMGNFGESLAMVQMINSSFVTNTLTSEGRASLAAEIERLQSE